MNNKGERLGVAERRNYVIKTTEEAKIIAKNYLIDVLDIKVEL